MRKTNSALFSLTVLISSFSLALLIAEGVSRVYEWRYAKGADSSPESVPDTDRPVSCNALHPLWGFSLRSGLRVADCVEPAISERIGKTERWGSLQSNNWGFLTPHTYPPEIKSHQCNVAVFGGSFATWLVVTNSALIETRLSQLPACNGRPARLFNFASFGFKQPQHSFVLTLLETLGVGFDFVFLVDGFNEAALASINLESGWAAWLPSAQHLGPLQDLLFPIEWDRGPFERQIQLYTLQRNLDDLERRKLDTPSALYRLWLRYQGAQQRNAIFSLQNPGTVDRATAPAVQMDTAGKIVEADSILLNVWSHGAQTMAQRVKTRGGEFIHVLQPNQYYGKRRFPPEESRIAISDRSPYRAAVARLYPQMASRGQQRKSGVFIDGTAVFDTTPGMVYVDSCCHVTAEAYAVFFTELMKHLDEPR